MLKHLMLLFALLLAGCGQGQDVHVTQPEYGSREALASGERIFAIHPLHNPARLFEMYEPLIDYLNQSIPQAGLRLEASRNYAEFEKKIRAREPAFILPNPYQTLLAQRSGYRVIAKMGDDDKFVGIILVRRDRGIRQVSDLKGEAVAYPAPTALAATMMPQYFFHTHGLDVERDIDNRYVGSQESSIMSVYYGRVAAGATWMLPWLEFQTEHPDKASELEARWVTEPLINNSVLVRDDVPVELAQAVAQALHNLHTTPAGQAVLERIKLSRFELADDQRYQVVGDFLRAFSENVRTLDGLTP